MFDLRNFEPKEVKLLFIHLANQEITLKKLDGSTLTGIVRVYKNKVHLQLEENVTAQINFISEKSEADYPFLECSSYSEETMRKIILLKKCFIH